MPWCSLYAMVSVNSCLLFNPPLCLGKPYASSSLLLVSRQLMCLKPHLGPHACNIALVLSSLLAHGLFLNWPMYVPSMLIGLTWSNHAHLCATMAPYVIVPMSYTMPYGIVSMCVCLARVIIITPWSCLELAPHYALNVA